jgi:hypothetical protein
MVSVTGPYGHILGFLDRPPDTYRFKLPAAVTHLHEELSLEPLLAINVEKSVI